MIRRRILVNYHIDPLIVQKLLPPPFRPKLIHGLSIGGICLIRLEQIHPSIVPLPFGFSSENAAHRIAVEWEENGELREGVYIARRDTSSTLNASVGGRLFPGMHHYSAFKTQDNPESIYICVNDPESPTYVELDAAYAEQIAKTSIFSSLAEASGFFEGGTVGYSVTHSPLQLDTIELRTFGWKVEPLRVNRIVSNFYENRSLFPEDSVEFDCALAMRNVMHEWHAHEPFHIATETA